MANKKIALKKPVKKKKPKAPSILKQITDSVVKLCEEDDDLFLFDMDNDSAIIVKRIQVTTFHVQNSQSFCPYDKYERKEFTIMFRVWFEGLNFIPETFLPNIIALTPEEAVKAIISYDGESV